MFRTYKDTVRIELPDRAIKENPLKYFCELCDIGSADRIWDSEPDLEIHRRNAHKKQLILLVADRNKFICTVCLYQQADEKALITHIKTQHLLSPADINYVKHEIFICDYCKKIFFNKQLLSIHISYQHVPKEERTASTTCPACYNRVTMKSIWFHFLHHGIIHTASCPICLKTFDNTNEVIQHIEQHKGYYNCAMCSYETKKESLYTNHLQKHKKTVDLTGKKDIERIFKYFVPQMESLDWSCKFLNIFKGLKLDIHTRVCILCRAICTSNEEMLQHIYGDHSPNSTTEVKKHLCVCGEEFFNNILLKHHIFTLKGEHKVFNGTKEELDKMLKEMYAEPGDLFIDVDMVETDSESNPSNITIQDTTENNVDTAKDTDGIEDEPNDTQNNEQINEICIASTTDVLKSNNDQQINSETLNDIPRRDTVIHSPSDSFEKGTGTIHDGQSSNKYIRNIIIQGDSNNTSENFNTPKGYYEQVIFIRDDQVQISGMQSSEQIQYIPDGSQQFVYKVLVPADPNNCGEKN